MGRIVGIDYGLKRVGLAVTDPLQIIASPLETVAASQILTYLQQYCQAETVDAFVVGFPKNLDNSDTHATQPVKNFTKQLQKQFKQPVYLEDERFTSKMALDAMIAGGTSKKYRRQKGSIDKVSATIILQSYLEKKL
ncbi:MAG: Holliday junction resolvase RuvX [Cyclobacteriaceae bacterium]